jgi:hypothetical protein
MTQMEKAVQKARELAAEYQGTLVGCGHCSFAATIDALRSVGIELVDERLENEMFKGLLGLTGGIGNMGYGTCGALTGAGFAVSLAVGIGRKQLDEDKRNRWISYYHVKRGLADKWIAKYHGLTCRETQIKLFGRAWNSRIPEMSKQLFDAAQARACRIPEACTIANAAAMAVETIIDMRENPQDLEYLKEKQEG